MDKDAALLKQVCPIILEQGFGGIGEGVSECLFDFVSNRDKGIKPALREVFPEHCESSCAKHIEANITQRYGRKCGHYSTRNGNHLLDLVSTTRAYFGEIRNG